jgi:hypothetical protein
VDGSSGSFAEEVALGRETCTPTKSSSTPGSSSAAGSVMVGDGAGVGMYVGGEGSAGGGGGVGVGGVGAGGLRPWEPRGGLRPLGGLWCLPDRVIGVGVEVSSGSFAEEVALGRETCTPTKSSWTPGSSSAAGSVVVGDGTGVGVYVGGGGVGVGGVGPGGLRPWEPRGGLCPLGGLWCPPEPDGVIGVGVEVYPPP